MNLLDATKGLIPKRLVLKVIKIGVINDVMIRDRASSYCTFVSTSTTESD